MGRRHSSRLTDSSVLEASCIQRELSLLAQGRTFRMSGFLKSGNRYFLTCGDAKCAVQFAFVGFLDLDHMRSSVILGALRRLIIGSRAYRIESMA